MSLAQPMKEEPEFALTEDNIIKEEEFEAHEEVFQAEVRELEHEESEMKAEPLDIECSDPKILKDNDELMMDGNQPLCVVSEISTLDHNCVKQSTTDKIAEIKYPIRECWVRLERCDAAENTARLHTNAVTTRSANCHTDKPYHCETCNGKLDSRQFCQTCKNLNPVSLKTEVFRTRLITKMNLMKVSKNERDFQRSTSGVGKKPYTCEICKTTIYNNQRFCPACAREKAARQLLTIIK